MKNNKGVTLMMLVITIIVLIILVGITSSTSYDVLNSAKLEVFTTELKMMQEQVNMLYQKLQTGDGTIQINGETYKIIPSGEGEEDILGIELNESLDIDYKTALEGALKKEINEEDINKYRYYDKETIENLNLQGIDQEFLVDVETKTVISLTGFENEGKKYYTLEQLEETYNVDYEDPHENNDENEVDFQYSVVKNENDSWTITLTITNVSKYVSADDYTIEYKLEGTDYWTKVDSNPFIVYNAGEYNVKVTDLSGNYSEQQVNVTN